MNTNDLIKFSYLNALAYLKLKHSDCGLFKGNNILIENFAVEISASFFSRDKNDEIHFISNNDFPNINDLSKSDIEFIIYKTIKEKVERAVKFELLKNDLIIIEEYHNR